MPALQLPGFDPVWLKAAAFAVLGAAVVYLLYSRARTVPEKERFCPTCGASVKSGDDFCPTCGNPVADDPHVRDKKRCTGCGEVVRGDARSCWNCDRPMGR